MKTLSKDQKIKLLEDNLNLKEVQEKLIIEATIRIQKELLQMILNLSLKYSLGENGYTSFMDKQNKIIEIEKEGLWK